MENNTNGKIDRRELGARLSKFKGGQGDVMLPLFELEYEANLNDALLALGMSVAFSGEAD